MKVRRFSLKLLPVRAFVAVFVLSAMALAATSEKILSSFTGTNGDGPLHCGLLLSGGNLFGVTTSGGDHKQGVVFELSPSGNGWTETVLYSFTGGSDGGDPIGTLTADKLGNLYGTASVGGSSGQGVVFELIQSNGNWAEKVLHNFGTGGGVTPFGGVVFDKAGNLYGTTEGGEVGSCPDGAEDCGVVYKLSPRNGQWLEQVLYRFTGHGDGALPLAGVTLDSAGNVYGTTAYGGAGVGFGVVFELTNTNGLWSEKVLHAFTDTKTDGAYPTGGIVFDQAGNLYGTTAEGGATFNGTVYELSPSAGGWNETLLYSFQGGVDGIFPEGNLTLDTDGDIFGNTTEGGTGHCPAALTHTCGTVFELTPEDGSWVKTEIYEFQGGNSDGGVPQGGMVLDNGELFGMGVNGGSADAGVVFEVRP